MQGSSRLLSVLNLFTRDHPTWRPEAINEKLSLSRATGYRLIKELVDAGFLRKIAAGHYALGARIIELDYHMRESDPLLLTAAPLMNAMSADTGLDGILSTLFGRQRLVNIHRSSPDGALSLRYGRGRPVPLFRGAASKMMMAHMPRTELQKVHRLHEAEIRAEGLGDDWPAFRKRMADYRSRGMYLSRGEIDPGIAAAAVALVGDDSDVLGALALVGTIDAIDAIGEARLREVLTRTVTEILARLTRAMA